MKNNSIIRSINTVYLSTFILLAALTLVQASVELRLLTENPRARCLDGSYPGYYFQAGTDSGANKFYVYLEGGYFCNGLT